MTAETATSKTYDVIIVGGGPGGSTSAMFLAKKGYKVLVLEKQKYPRDKICGDAISGKSVGMLKELGIEKDIEKIDHAKVYGLVFSSPEGKTLEIPFPVKDGEGNTKPRGYVVRRIVMDNFLFQHAKKVADTREQFEVKDLLFDEQGKVIGVKGVDLNTKEEHSFHSKFVIGADGSYSVVANKVNAEKVPEDHLCEATRVYYKNVAGITPNIEIHFVDSVMPGYFWIFPLENGMANVGLGMVRSDRQKKGVNLVKETEKVIMEHPLFKERFKDAEKLTDIKGWTLPFGSFKRKLHGPGYFLVGDAASLVDPFSGEGVGNAMTSAKFVSEVIDEAVKANDFSEAKLAQYDERLWKEIGPEMQTSYMLQKIGRHKWLLNLVVGKAVKSKEIRDTISGMLVNEEARKTFITPMFYVKLLLA
ncbi:MAG: NAD(P)/FAD-dependent oxidoreductase [Candidatus Iainarchaeum archaeon]|uniref:NAD(P)/FAD-dependent oxidoreductase n=1 Tax=Candidatus Iainarchaeum sp. TaxID=3101447 RepID=A0A7T9DKD3_9ARCH|nr:MAG: NAD(P)/FAD-dependent oxidoreductase [Candidatus Diapherotrites archaeon]